MGLVTRSLAPTGSGTREPHLVHKRPRLLLATGLFGLLLAVAPPQGAKAQTLLDVAKAAQQTGQAIFGSSEFKSASLRALPQWRGVLSRMDREREGLELCLAAAEACGSSDQRALSEMIARSKDLGRREKLKRVNLFFNRWPYREDRATYGKREHWASPTEFMTSSGDCEDYAIAKFFALRRMGFSNEELRIVVLWDRIRAIGHAVVAVYDGDEILILDNLSPMVTSHWRYSHYIPQYSMNETARWAHVHTKKIPALLAQRD